MEFDFEELHRSELLHDFQSNESANPLDDRVSILDDDFPFEI